MKVKVILATNNAVRNITNDIEDWITRESPSEIVSMSQSSCYSDSRREHIVTVTILYRKQTQQ